MKIIRCLDESGRTFLASQTPEGVFEIEGSLFEPLRVTTRKVGVRKILAPLTPTTIFCIGLNYRKHAEETKAKIPEWPVLFMKSPAAVQNPGDPIELPVKL